MGTSILRLRGLPYTATEAELVDFFSDWTVEATHICTRNGKPTGEAYVEFSSAEDAAQALKKKNHEHIGSRYVEIFECLEAGLVAKSAAAAAAEPGGEGEAAPPPPPPSLRGHVVRLRGLPFASSAGDVLAFFSGIEVVGGEAGAIFTCTPDGRPAGEAYVELASSEDKQAALERHKEKIGSRYIEIFDSSKGDMFQAVQQHGCFTAVGGKRRHHWPAGAGGGPHGGAQQSGGVQYGDVGPGRGGRGQQGHDMEQMAAAFAGFGISPHDIQVPGPPRGAFMPFGGPPGDDSRQYGARPGPQGPMGPPTHWRPPTQLAPGPAHMGSRPPQFSRAPGPPPGKNSGGGGRGQQQGGGGLFEYGTTPPLMMQAPFMLQPPPFMHPQQPGSPWAAAMMATAQQGGGWYGAGVPGPSGRGGMMGMPGPYTTYGPGYYMRSPGMSPPPHMGHGGGALGGMPLAGYPRAMPHAAPGGHGGGGSGGGGGHHPPASSSGPQVHVPVPHPHPQHNDAAPPPPPPPPAGGGLAGGIGGRGDSSHSLTGLAGATAAVPVAPLPPPDAAASDPL